MRYQVRLADVAEARQRVLPMWARNLPVRGSLEDKLRWFYSDGPHGPGHAFVIEGATDPDGNAAIHGSAGVGVRTLWMRESPLRAAVLADLAIDRDERNRIPAVLLVGAVKKYVSGAFDLAYGFPSVKAATVYERTGHRELGRMRRYVRVLRTTSYLEPRLHVTWIARAIGSAIDRGLAADAVIRRRCHRALQLVWLDTFDERFDHLWSAARRIAPILCERSSAFLRWRFLEQPGHEYRVAAVIETATRELRAYAVLRERSAAVEIVDLFGVRLPDLDAMLSHLIPALQPHYTSVSFRFLGSRDLRAVLARHHFVLRPDLRIVALTVGLRIENHLEIYDPEAWYLTDLDEDA